MAEYGATANEATAAEALLSFRSELNYVTEVPVLIAVDGYSALEGASDWHDTDDADWYNTHKKYPTMPADRLGKGEGGGGGGGKERNCEKGFFIYFLL